MTEIIESIDRFCVYGVASDYQGMVELVRFRLEELQTTHESVDEVSGLHGGYTSKIVAPIPIKSMGKVSMGPILQTLGLALIVVRDDEAFQKIKHRLAKRERPNLPRHLGQFRPKWLLTPKKASKLRVKWWSGLSDAQKKRIQRKAQKGQAASRRRARKNRERLMRKSGATHAQ